MRFDASGSANLPRSRATVLLCAQPFGISTAIPIFSALRDVRADVKMAAAAIHAGATGLDEHCIFLDGLPQKSFASANYRAVRQAVSWLKAGRCLVLFMAGERSHWTDPNILPDVNRWNGRIASLIVASDAVAAPVFVDYETDAIAVRLGAAILPDTLAAMPSRRHAAAYLRFCTVRMDTARAMPAVPRIA